MTPIIKTFPADVGREFERKGFKVTFSGDTANVELMFDIPMLLEPVRVLREIEGYRICESTHAPTVWILPPDDRLGYSAMSLNIAVERVTNRIAEIKINRRRIAGERRVVNRTIKELLKAGYTLSVDNGGDDLEVFKSTSFREVSQAMMQVDDERLIARKDGRNHVVYFVYGNDAWEVINDYSVRLDDVLAPVWELTRKLEERGR